MLITHKYYKLGTGNLIEKCFLGYNLIIHNKKIVTASRPVQKNYILLITKEVELVIFTYNL